MADGHVYMALLLSLNVIKAPIGNWGIYLLPKTIFFPDANRMGVKTGRSLSLTI